MTESDYRCGDNVDGRGLRRTRWHEPLGKTIRRRDAIRFLAANAENWLSDRAPHGRAPSEYVIPTAPASGHRRLPTNSKD